MRGVPGLFEQLHAHVLGRKIVRGRQPRLVHYQRARRIRDRDAVEFDPRSLRARYEADRKKDILLSATLGVDAALKAHQLDALLFPGAAGSAIAARPGYPTVIVPFALVANAATPPFPDAFEARQAPFGVSFTGTACSEPRLIALAYAFEQATRARVPPGLFP